LIGGLVWLPAWQSASDNRVTQWIYDGELLSNWLAAIARVLGWIITMLSLLPVEGTTLPIVFASGSVLVAFVFWALPIFVHGIRVQLGQSLTRGETQVLGGYVLAAIALFLSITYGLSADLTIAARYHFVYFPAVIVLLGAALAICWDAAKLAARMELGWTARQQSLLHFLKARGKKAVVLILLMGFLGGLTVVSNLGYQKVERPDLLVPIMQKTSQVPILIATAHKTHEQTGDMMNLGLEFKHSYRSLEPAATSSPKHAPLFLLAHQEPNSNNSAITLLKTLNQLPRPLDLWLVNFPRGASGLDAQNCFADSQSRPKVNGYNYRLYHCQ
jgi:uncharacterized membrane protein